MRVTSAVSIAAIALSVAASAALSTLLLWPTEALADEKPEIIQAREDFRDGVARMTADDFAGALAKFNAVAKVKMNAQVAFNMAECEDHLGQLVEALGNYRLAETKAADGSAPEVAKAVDERLAKLKKRIPALTLTRVEATPNPRAMLQLDGVDVAPSSVGAPMSVDPGLHVVTVVIGGKVIDTRKVTLDDGGQKTLKLDIPAPIEVNDTHDPTVPPTPPLPPVRVGPSGPGIALVVIGGLGLVAGFVGIGIRQAAIGDLNTLCDGKTTCPKSDASSGQSDVSRGRAATGLAEVGLPVGVVGIVTGAILLATHGKSKSKDESAPTVSFQPAAPSCNGPGASMLVRF